MTRRIFGGEHGGIGARGTFTGIPENCDDTRTLEKAAFASYELLDKEVSSLSSAASLLRNLGINYYPTRVVSKTRGYVYKATTLPAFVH